MITETLVAIFVLLVIIKSVQRPKGFPPGPRGLPFVGYFPFIGTWDALNHKGLKKMCDTYGPVTGFYMGPNTPMVAVSSHEAVKEALMNEDLLGRPQLAGRTFGEPLGLVFVDGPQWQEQRRFCMRHLKNLGSPGTSVEDQMVDEIRDLINDVRSASQADPDLAVDFKGVFRMSVVNVLWAIIGGQRYQRSDPQFEKLREAAEEFLKSGNAISPQLPLLRFVFKLFPFLAPSADVSTDLLKPMQDLIQESIDDHAMDDSYKQTRDFIDVYLNEIYRINSANLKTSFTPKQLAAVLLDICRAGAESTSSAIGNAIIHLIRNRDIQKKMQLEMDSVCGQALPKLCDRKKLPYTNAVLMEAQRCTSTAPLTVPHVAIADTTIHEYFIPEKTVVLVNLDAVLNDKSYWKDPENFRPERHLNRDGTKIIKSDHFYPFGIGRRMCSGESLAKNIYFLFTAALVKCFSFEALPNKPLHTLEPTTGFTLGYRGFKAVAIPRNPEISLS